RYLVPYAIALLIRLAKKSALANRDCDSHTRIYFSASPVICPFLATLAESFRLACHKNRKNAPYQIIIKFNQNSLP
ncbi:MAG: hypothetical protein E6Z60_14935, partial [Mixta calida]|nr:hypothetical protein [Mixta calida]